MDCQKNIKGGGDAVDTKVIQTCLDCPSETGKRPLDCRKYFGSDHLKYKRQKKFHCKSKRIRLLAQPKYYTAKYAENNYESRQNIDVSREVNLPARIKMLSVPKVRKLVASYQDYRKIIDKEKLNNISDLIQNSLMTMYSRLANVHLIDSKTRSRKWTKADWQKHCEWLKERACPKKIPELNQESQKCVPLNELQNSIYNLSRPRHPRKKYRPIFGYQCLVRNASKKYIPTKRLIKLAEPKKKPELEKTETENEVFYANPNALTYNASDRIKQLARPKIVPKANVKTLPETTKYGVLARALKASLSERTIKLSKPKPKDDDDDEPKPGVSPKALKAKPTPRILELAKPRKIP